MRKTWGIPKGLQLIKIAIHPLVDDQQWPEMGESS
jgi:hypothetical protein